MPNKNEKGNKKYRTPSSPSKANELINNQLVSLLEEKVQIINREVNQAALQEMFDAWLLTDAADVPEERRRMVELMQILRSL